MLLKTFVFSIFTLCMYALPLRAEETNEVVNTEATQAVVTESEVINESPLLFNTVEPVDAEEEVVNAVQNEPVPQVESEQELEPTPVVAATPTPVETPPVPAPAITPTPASVLPHVSGAALTPEEKDQVKDDRRARREEWIKAHPEQLQQMRENSLKRKQWMQDHPKEALEMKEKMIAMQKERRLKMEAAAAGK